MNAYLDSSVVVRSLLHEPGAIENWSQWDLTISSAVMPVEAFRAIDRLRVMGQLNDIQLADTIDALRVVISHVQEVELERAVLRRAAAPFSSVVATLDAIHIATALLWMEDQQEPLLFVTHDAQQAVAARLAGLDVKTVP